MLLLFQFSFVDCRFFVVANSIVCAYLILSLPLSIVHIIRSRAKYSRLLLIFLDAVRLINSSISSKKMIVHDESMCDYSTSNSMLKCANKYISVGYLFSCDYFEGNASIGDCRSICSSGYCVLSAQR